MKEKKRVLIVDDNEDDVEYCIESLANDPQHEWEALSTDNGKDALNIIRVNRFDCMLLDYSLPALNGIEVLQQLRENNIELPVIMLTGQGSERIAVESMKYGAQDYLTKDEIKYPNIVNVMLQGIERKKRELTIFQRANYDHLTGLAGRALYQDRINSAIERCLRLDSHFMLIFLDLDKFKGVNDVHGHKAGDLMLKEVAVRLESCVRKSDTVARLGGDEYAIIVENIDSKNSRSIEKLLTKIHSAITSQPIYYKNVSLDFNASIGAAIYPDSAKTCDELEALADKAMYKSKQDCEKKFNYIR